jgi:hypothetical protein
MRKLLLATILVAGFATLSSAAIAQTTPVDSGAGAGAPASGGGEPTDIPGHPRVNQIDQRDNNQQNRIDKGEADGQLSKGQATRDQAHLDHEESVQKNQEAHNGGHLTKAEQRHDNKKLNKSSRKIHRQRHGGRHHKK